ncbi:MAG: hypothetical protein OXH63_04450 [Gemmatimonadetes bacterium]|nr:hypothetical protein [Gemmatimonadota bacterium]
MPTEQPLTELTTRDVLLQVDRRLTLIEDDLRTLDQKWDQRFGTLDQKIDTQNSQLRQEMNTKFHWTLGVVLASWISTIGTLLLK